MKYALPCRRSLRYDIVFGISHLIVGPVYLRGLLGLLRIVPAISSKQKLDASLHSVVDIATIYMVSVSVTAYLKSSKLGA
jgi:hypothetical protein